MRPIRLLAAAGVIVGMGGLLLVAAPVMAGIVWAVWSRQVVVEALKGEAEADW